MFVVQAFKFKNRFNISAQNACSVLNTRFGGRESCENNRSTSTVHFFSLVTFLFSSFNRQAGIHESETEERCWLRPTSAP